MEIDGLLVRIDGDASGLEQALNSAKSSMSGLGNLTKNLKSDTDSLANAMQKHTAAAKASSSSAKEGASAKKEESAQTKELDKFVKGLTKSLRDEARAAKMSASSMNELTAEEIQAAAAKKEIVDRSKRAASSLGAVGGAASATAGAMGGLSTAAGGAISAAGNLATAFAEGGALGIGIAAVAVGVGGLIAVWNEYSEAQQMVEDNAAAAADALDAAFRRINEASENNIGNLQTQLDEVNFRIRAVGLSANQATRFKLSEDLEDLGQKSENLKKALDRSSQSIRAQGFEIETQTRLRKAGLSVSQEEIDLLKSKRDDDLRANVQNKINLENNQKETKLKTDLIVKLRELAKARKAEADEREDERREKQRLRDLERQRDEQARLAEAFKKSAPQVRALASEYDALNSRLRLLQDGELFVEAFDLSALSPENASQFLEDLKSKIDATKFKLDIEVDLKADDEELRRSLEAIEFPDEIELKFADDTSGPAPETASQDFLDALSASDPNKAVAELEKSVEQASSTIELFGEEAGDSLNDVPTASAEFIEALSATDINQALEEVGERNFNAQTDFQKALNSTTDAVVSLTDFLSDAGNAVLQFVEDLGGVFLDFAGAGAGAAVGVSVGLLAGNEDVAEGSTAAGAALGGAIQGTIDNLANGDIAGAIFAAIVPLVEASEAFSDAQAALSVFAVEALAGLEPVFAGIRELVEPLASITTVFLDLIGILLESSDLFNLFGEYLTIIGDTFETFAPVLATVFEAVGGLVGQVLGTFVEKLGEVDFSPILDAFIVLLPVVTTLGEALGSILGTGIAVYFQLVGLYLEALSPLLLLFAAALEFTLVPALELLAVGINFIIEGIGTAIAFFIENITAGVADLIVNLAAFFGIQVDRPDTPESDFSFGGINTDIPSNPDAGFASSFSDDEDDSSSDLEESLDQNTEEIKKLNQSITNLPSIFNLAAARTSRTTINVAAGEAAGEVFDRFRREGAIQGNFENGTSAARLNNNLFPSVSLNG